MKHDNNISIIRVAAMLLIVAYHCLCFNAGVWDSNYPVSYGPWFLAVDGNVVCIALDAFVFISGILYCRIATTTDRYDNRKKFLKNKVLRLLIPYLFWGVIVCLLFSLPFTKILHGVSHLWFLLMLFDVFIIADITRPLWMRLGKWGTATLPFALIVVFGIEMKIGIFPKYDLGLHAACGYLPQFFLGIAVERLQIWKRINIKSSLLYILTIAMFAFGVWLQYVHVPTSWIWQMPAFALLVMLYTAMRHNSAIARLGGGGRCWRLITTFDHYSLAVYIIHHILIYMILWSTAAQDFLSVHYIVGPILLFAVVLPASFLVAYVISYLPKFDYIIGVGRKRNKNGANLSA